MPNFEIQKEMKRNGNNRKRIRGTTPVKPIGGRLKKINLLFIIDQPFMSGCFIALS